MHLMRVCMKGSTQEERIAEVAKAKESQRLFLWTGRTWEYADIVKFIPQRPARIAFVKELVRRGFFIENMPHAADLEEEAEATTTAALSAAPAEAAPAEATPAVATGPAPEETSSNEEDDDTDPTYQR